ncbi:type II restriction endonuclease [Gimesia maris]|uniref:type II restriction endonuclease n=1 Tax=Gimesia maris TaxID=122 RepID=UPI0030D9AE2D
MKSRFQVKGEKETESIELNFTVRLILEQIGIEVEETAEDHLDELLSRFGNQFPSTREFSDYSRTAFPEISPLDDPDQTILEWMDREETLFRTLERHIVQDRLDAGFSEVDTFISFSLSVLNRRKSRAGHALENHLEAIFTAHNIRYARGKETENRAKPDFVFPSIEEYRDKNFPENLLTMLGAKQTCKDRWRQVLSEAKRIELKHLFTLEPGISENQTEEMKSQKLQLVIPVPLIETYSKSQQGWLMNFVEFLDVVKHRQK